MAALLNPHEPSEIGSLIIRGLDLTCAFEGVDWNFDGTEVEVGGVCREGDFTQTTGKQGTLTGDFYGALNNGYVTNHLDFTAITVGGQIVLPQTYNLTFNGSFAKAALPAATLGMADGLLRKNYTGTLELVLDDNAIVQALVVAAEAMNTTASSVALSFTLLGQAITLPIKLVSVSHPIRVGDFQKITLGWQSQAPARGTAFPTAPTALPGTPGLLDWALLDWRTALSFTFLSNTIQGLQRTGSLKFDSFSFAYSDREITRFNYRFMTFGNWTTSIVAGG